MACLNRCDMVGYTSANKPATKSTTSIITLTGATLTKMEVTTLVAEMLEERIGGICESMANSAGHMDMDYV